MECLLPYLCMVTVSHIMVGLERTLDYRGVGLARFHCTTIPPVQQLSPILFIDLTNLTSYANLTFSEERHIA